MRLRRRPPRPLPLVALLATFAVLASACTAAEGEPRRSESPDASWSPSVITSGSPEGGFDATALQTRFPIKHVV
ncbi:MAG TPA: hypothetical protein VFR44_05415, partial [Actinomycetota bacterium]|nr:hypothetical protein [Actinomycetota bacterium]